MWGIVFGLVIAAAPLEVKGDTTCPQPTEVEALFVKTKTSETLGQGHQALITQRGDGVTLRLEDAQGAILGEKVLPRGSCDGLAAAAAATLVVWETNFSPRRTNFVAAPPRKPLPSPEGTVLDADESPLAWRGDVAVSGTLSGLTPRPGLFVAVASGPRDAAWRIFLTAAGTLSFESTVGQGRVHWSRPSLGLGASLRVAAATVQVDVSAAFEAAALRVSGEGYTQNLSVTAFDPGAAASLRLSGALARHLGWFAELSTAVYPLGKTAVVKGGDLRLPIPPFGLALRAGFYFGER